MIPLPSIDDIAGSPVFAVLTLDGRRLLLPQTDLAILELRADMRAGGPPGTVGLFVDDDGEWPVYSLDSGLQLQTTAPASRYVCSMLNAVEPGMFQGLLADEIGHLQNDVLSVHPLAPSLQQPNMVLAALALLGDEVLYVTTSAHLQQHVAATTERSNYA